MDEPILKDEDRRIWQRWRKTCLRWSESRAHKRRVLRAAEAVDRMRRRAPDAYVGWSGGKDSTALAHLVTVTCGLDATLMSIKDDFDFPGEVDYVERLADQWGADLDVLTPDFSLQQWVADRADELSALEDFHSRASEFSDRAFYSLIEAYRNERGRPGVYLGIRKHESAGRLGHRAAHGLVYQKKDGETVCQPIADWEGRDVYAYLFSRDIEIHPVYRCVRLHDHPSDVRKSWWLAGDHASRGATVWLRTYWPSLYRRLCEILPDTASHA